MASVGGSTAQAYGPGRAVRARSGTAACHHTRLPRRPHQSRDRRDAGSLRYYRSTPALDSSGTPRGIHRPNRSLAVGFDSGGGDVGSTPCHARGALVTTAAGSTDRAQRVANTLTAGAMSVAVLGIVAFTSDSITPQNSPGAAKAQSSAAAPNVASIDSLTTQPSSIHPNIVVASTTAPETTPVSEGTAPAGGRHHNNGCDGNPTSAPPPVPVRSLGTGSPVTHPDAGGCRT